MRPYERLRETSLRWLIEAAPTRHLYKHRWLGERFYHLPGDMVALQEIAWTIKPRLVIHTGVAAGGGPIFLASLLALLGNDGLVAAVDPHPREEGLKAIAEHPLAPRIRVITGDPGSDAVVAELAALARERPPVMAVFDLIHTHEHVKRELTRVAPLVDVGSYAVVLDTVMEDMPEDFFRDRPYGKGNNPGTAVREFLREDSRFEADPQFEDRVLLTLAPGGFLKRVR